MRMRGRLRDIARATHRRHFLIWHVEAGRLSSQGVQEPPADSSLTQSLADVILPGELTDFSQSPHKLPHRAREIAGNRPSSGQTPNKNVGNPRFKKNTPEVQNGRAPPNQPIRDKPPHESGTSPHTIPWLHKLPRQTGTSPHTSPSQDNLPKPPGIRADHKRPYTPDASAPRPDTTKHRTPKWACGRCTIELPGPSPAFDA